MQRNRALFILSGMLAASTTFHLLAAEAADPAAAKSEPEQKAPTWEKSAAIGFSLTRGNSDSILFNASAQATKKWRANELKLGVDGSYGEVDDKKNAENAHAFAQYNRLFNDKLFGYIRVDGLHDEIAALDYRVSVGPGVGYYFIKETNMTLGLEVGPGYVTERRGSKDNDFMTLRVAQNFEYKFSSRARVWESVEYLPQVDRFSNYQIIAEVGVEAGLTEKIKLRVFAQDTYANEPARGRKQNDFKLVSALAFSF